MASRLLNVELVAQTVQTDRYVNDCPWGAALQIALGAPGGAQERFWATKIMPWNGPGPLQGTKIFILRRFRACPFSSPQTGPIHKETLRGGSGDVWEHHFHPKSSFYEGFGLVAFTYDVASKCVFFSIFTNTSYFTSQNGPRRPKPSIFTMKYGARKGKKMTSKVAKTVVKR